MPVEPSASLVFRPSPKQSVSARARSQIKLPGNWVCRAVESRGAGAGSSWGFVDAGHLL